MKKTTKNPNKVIFVLGFLQLYKNVLLYTHIFMTETSLLYLTKTGIEIQTITIVIAIIYYEKPTAVVTQAKPRFTGAFPG